MPEFDQALQTSVHATVCPFACVRVHEETVPRYETVALMRVRLLLYTLTNCSYIDRNRYTIFLPDQN